MQTLQKDGNKTARVANKFVSLELVSGKNIPALKLLKTQYLSLSGFRTLKNAIKVLWKFFWGLLKRRISKSEVLIG